MEPCCVSSDCPDGETAIFAPSRTGPRRRSGSVVPDDHLAEVLLGVEVLVSGGDLLEAERLVEHRAKLVMRDRQIELLEILATSGGGSVGAGDPAHEIEALAPASAGE